MVMEAASHQLYELESLSWSVATDRMNWIQGEHVTLIGPTGSGKTELLIELIRPLSWVIFLSTKRIDRTIDPLRQIGYRTIRSAKELNPEVDSRFIVSPRWPRKMSAAQQKALHRKVYDGIFDRAFRQTGWTLVIDELEYINRYLRIEESLDRLLTQGRSQDNSVFSGTQRPRNVTLHAYEQARHLFIWRQSDMSNIIRAAELTGLDKQDMVRATRTLEPYCVLYVNTHTGEKFITNTRWE